MSISDLDTSKTSKAFFFVSINIGIVMLVPHAG
jgi:hypothetical protein